MVLLAVAAPFPVSADTVTPPPVGGPVGSAELRLVDHSRVDPWMPGTPRSISVTVTYPAAPQARGAAAPYVGLPTAGLTRHAIENAPVDTGRGPLPLVIFSPGYLAPRFAYSALTEDLASRGYVVVSIDHTGEALVTIEPDGQMRGYSQSDPYSETGLRTSIDTRVADARFVIDEAEAIAKGERTGDADGRPLPDGLASVVDPTRVGMFGHSIGGATTTEVLLDEPRLDAGVNVDGALLYGNSASRITTTDPHRPLLSILNSEHAASREGRERFWNAYLATPRTDWHREYSFVGTGHFSFSDAEAIVPQWVPDIPGLGGPAGLNLGTAPRTDVIAATRDLIAATFDRFLSGEPSPFLDAPTERYPFVVPVTP